MIREQLRSSRPKVCPSISRNLMAVRVLFSVTLALALPLCASAQQWQASGNDIVSMCPSISPCKVIVNQANPTNAGIGMDVAGDVWIRGTNTDLGVISSSGSAAISTNSAATDHGLLMFRSGASESVILRREAVTNDFTIQTGVGAPQERMRITNTGNVGIGGAPATKFHVFGASAQGRFDSAAATDARHEYYYNGARVGMIAWFSDRVELRADTSKELRLGSNDAAHVFIASNGNVGIGSAPTQALEIIKATADAYGRTRTGGTGYSGWLSQTANRQWYAGLQTGSSSFLIRDVTGVADRVVIDSLGRVGIGTTAPTALLHVAGAARFNLSTPLSTGATVVARDSVEAQRFGGGTDAPGMFFTGARGTEAAPLANAINDETGRLVIRGYDGATTISSARIGAIVDGAVSTGVLPQAITFKTGSSGTPSEHVRITSSGNVGIGTATPAAKLHVVGDVVVAGNITGARVLGAVYQDVAEWVPSSDDLTPGTVVILDKRTDNTVTPSREAYDTLVAGVVSAQPGILLGEGSASKEQIATFGRVLVRVDASKGAVEIGDLLVTSDVPGTAMKSAPIDVAGIAIHRPGTIIGKALEPLPAGTREILVLLSLQ